MANVHRNGKPPKHLLHKVVLRVNDWQFDEDGLSAWMRQHMAHPVQYDVTTFNGSKGKLNRTIEFTAWFKTASDAKIFKGEWSK